MLANRRRLIVVALAVVSVLAMIVFGVYGLLRGPSRATNVRQAAAGGSDQTNGSGSPKAALPQTDDPIAYGRAVAEALFDWSASSGYSPADYTAVVLADADPSGTELPGLIEDLAGYEPTAAQWSELAGMQAVQHLRITGAVVPSLWPRALAEAHGRLRSGTTAVTITGVRRRGGVWYGQPATSTSPVSFTIFEACAPAFSRCHTLRFSKLDDPLR